MKLTKKLLAMALAGVMLLTILTGCSGGKNRRPAGGGVYGCFPQRARCIK